MKKNVFGRYFSRDANERKSLFKSLISALILQESIKTTSEKAKSIKGDVDKIINRAKRGNERQAIQLLQRNVGIEAMNKVIKDLVDKKIETPKVEVKSGIKELSAGKTEEKAKAKKTEVKVAKKETKRKVVKK